MDRTRKARKHLQRALISISDAENEMWMASGQLRGKPEENRIISLVMDVEKLREFIEQEERRLHQ